MMIKMKNFILKTILIALIAVGFTSCDDYLDVNTPSDAVNAEDVDMAALMAPIMQKTVFANYYAEVTFGNYSQYFGGYGNGAAGKASNPSTWSYIYLSILPNIRAIELKGGNVGAKKYIAVAQILEAINMGFAVDNWNNVPYSQATDPFTYVYPQFDAGQQVQTEVIALLDQAIATLNGSDDSGFNMGSEDLIYGSNSFDQWKKAAYTYKARMQLRLMNKGLASPADVLASIENGFTSNADDFELAIPSNVINPWYATNILARNTGNYYRAPNDQIITMMNGKTYPFESGVVEIDPRLPAIYSNEGADGDPWRGAMNGGEGESSDIKDDSDPENIIYYAANTFYKEGGFLTSEFAPISLMSYTEAMFIKAEALFLANGGNETSVGSSADAYAAYRAGISASMSKIGVNGSSYMADTSVDVGEEGLMLNHIMKEKYIANIHNTETYADFRRYNFSSDVFKGLALRVEADDSEGEMVGKWYQRAVYPTSEKTANTDVVDSNWQEPEVPVWWAN